MRRAVQGFTLLELLAVIVVIGILLGAVSFSYHQNIRRTNLSEAAASVTTALIRARSQAQRSSTNQNVSWTRTRLSVGSSVVDLPNGATFATAAASGYAYSAPYGEFITPGAPPGLRLEIVDSTGQYHTAVDTMGVTGKVIQRGVSKLADPILN